MEQQSNIPNKAGIHGALEADEEGYESLVRRDEEGDCTLSVLISGATCAMCIQKIESNLLADEAVKHARLNFSTRRLNVSWAGLPERANDLVQMVRGLGYGVQPFDPKLEQDDTKREERFLLMCLGVAGFAVGNLMLLSVGLWTTTPETMGEGMRGFMHWISALIALPTIIFAGRPFFRSAFSALKTGHTNMDVPISLALILASGMSVYETIHHGAHVYFDSAVMLMFFLLIGRYLDFRARKNARSSATDLLQSFTGFAQVVEGNNTRRILIRDLKVGMQVCVATGEKIPIDGEVLEGVSDVDTSLVTGETLPRRVEGGAQVFAGTMNISAPITIIVAKPAEDSLLADIVRLMEKAGQGQAKYVRLADRAAKLYTPVVHSFAAAAFLGWWLIGGLAWQDSLMIAVTVLIITCPCALGLAVPVVQVLATSRLMKAGILVKAGDALERLAQVDMVLLDKTGTLTLGQPVLEEGYRPEDLQLAASIAAHSSHPLSKALVQAYKGDVWDVQNVMEHPGQGLEAQYDGKIVRLGSRSWCGDVDVAPSEKLELWLLVEGEAPKVFYFIDQLRSDSAETIAQLKQHAIMPVMVSGDREVVAASIAQQCGIDEFYAEQKPPEKFEILEGYKQAGHQVLMVGDGLNDAPVLAGADVSMAPGSAIDMAQNAADIVFMGDKLAPVYEAYKVSRATQNLVKQNFTLAVLYNIVAVPLALCGLVTPLVAALAMSGSSLLVIANSFRLRFLR